MTFNVKTAPAIVHRAVCSYRTEQEETFSRLYNAPNSKGRPLWDHFEGREYVRTLAGDVDVTQLDTYKAWFAEKMPKKGFVSFYNLCFRKAEYLECQVMLFPDDKKYATELAAVRSWMEEVQEQVDAEDEENLAWAETRAAQDFERNAYGTD